MVDITCRAARTRAGLDNRLRGLDELLRRIETAFRKVAGGGGASASFRLELEDAGSTPYSIPEDVVTNTYVLQKALESLVGPRGDNPLGVEEVALLFADRLHGHPGVFGMMFDTGGYGREPYDDVPRQGCAVFLDSIREYRPTETQRSKETFFTAIHELGHVFNLWHVQSPRSFLASSPAGSKAYDSRCHKFLDVHRDFLRRCSSAPEVHPGGSRFGHRGDLGPPSGETTYEVENASSLKLEVRVAEEAFWRFEPVELDVVLSTTRSSGLHVPDLLDPGYEEFVIWIESPDGERRRYRPLRRYCQNVGEKELSRDRPIQRDVSVFEQAGGYTFRMPGEHRIWAELDLGKRRPLRSKAVTVEVEGARSSRDYRRLADALTDPRVRSVLYHRHGPVDSGTKSRIDSAAGKLPRGRAAALYYALGRARLRSTAGPIKAQQEKSGVSYLERALAGLDKECNRYLRAEELLRRLEA